MPTRDRAAPLARTLESLRAQGVLPAELIIVDASADAAPRRAAEEVCAGWERYGARLVWLSAERPGAAAQRNQGVALATHPFIWFFDDDILFERDCVRRLWAAIRDDPALGGVNAMIVNQRYVPPGPASRLIFRLMAGRKEASYAGRVLGPAVNLLPEDRDDLPEIVPVEWLNTTCSLYRREALPIPPFPAHFTGYSLMEDVALSLAVAKQWKLANVRHARIVHDSQPGSHKSDIVALNRMELVNRHYVMRRILERQTGGDWAKLVLWQLFQLSTCAVREKFGRPFRQMLRGTVQAFGDIAWGKSRGHRS